MEKRFFPLFVILASGLAACNAGEEPAAPAAAKQSAMDACAIVTQADASELFGQPASPDVGHSGVSMIAQCLWTWDTDTSNHLLQFHIWDPLGYDMPDDAEPLDLGEKGFIRKDPMGGVDIEWLQNNQLISLSYSTIGPDAPEAMDRVEQMIALARQVEDRL
jgi:hypothetical protein